MLDRREKGGRYLIKENYYTSSRNKPCLSLCIYIRITSLGDDNVVDRNVYQLDKEPNETHHAEPDGGGQHGSLKFCCFRAGRGESGEGEGGERRIDDQKTTI